MHFPPGLAADFDAESFEGSRLWDDDPALSTLLHYQLSETGKSVVLNGMWQQPAGQVSGRTLAERTEFESVRYFDCMALAVALRSEVFVDCLGNNIDLLCDKRE
jgi:hypothetical protein